MFDIVVIGKQEHEVLINLCISLNCKLSLGCPISGLTVDQMSYNVSAWYLADHLQLERGSATEQLEFSVYYHHWARRDADANIMTQASQQYCLLIASISFLRHFLGQLPWPWHDLVPRIVGPTLPTTTLLSSYSHNILARSCVRCCFLIQTEKFAWPSAVLWVLSLHILPLPTITENCCGQWTPECSIHKYI